MTSGVQMEMGKTSSGCQLTPAVFLEPGKPPPLGSLLFIQKSRRGSLQNTSDTVCLSWGSIFLYSRKVPSEASPRSLLPPVGCGPGLAGMLVLTEIPLEARFGVCKEAPV